MNAGVSVPLLMVNADSLALVDGLITVTLYVLVLVPFCAVTKMVTTFDPTTKVIGPEACPDATAVPLMVIVALTFDKVGVTVSDVVPLVTISV